MSVTPYCTDEDIAVRAGGDFAVLCPKDQKYACATDGSISANAWVLTSASFPDWTVANITPGMVVQILTTSATTNVGTRRTPINELLVVDTVSAGNLTLRRKGAASGIGMAPGGPGGLANVEFLIASFAPQIEEASYDLNRRYGVDDLILGRRTSDEYDPREVRQACVLTVLRNQYFAEARRAGTQDDSLWQKGKAVADDLAELLDRVALHWKPVGISPSGTIADLTTRFSTRLSR